MQYDLYGSGEQPSIVFEQILPLLRDLLSCDTPELLDVGAGRGNVYPIATRLGFSYTGVEIVAGARAEALRAHGVHLWQDIEDLPSDYRCDLVIMSEVIEHVPEPVHMLTRVRSLLRYGGVLYLTTPNANGARARIEGSSWNGYGAPAHLVYFTERSLRLALSSAGFRYAERMHVHISSPSASRSRRAAQWMVVKIGLEGTLRYIVRP